MTKKRFEFKPIGRFPSASNKDDIGENGTLVKSPEYNVGAESFREIGQLFFHGLRREINTRIVHKKTPVFPVYSFADIVFEVKQVDLSGISLNRILTRQKANVFLCHPEWNMIGQVIPENAAQN